MSKTAEEKREEREEKKRADRVKVVFAEIEKESKNGKLISSRELAKRTGYSEGLVRSTINLVNKTIAEYGKAGSKMIAYVPESGGGGWRVANSRSIWITWHATLHRHAETRVESLERFADVMEALWPQHVTSPGRLAAFYQGARQMLDNARAVMTPRPAPKPVPKRAKRGIRHVK